MPDHSAFNLSVSSWSRSDVGMVTANGIRWKPAPNSFVDRSQARLVVAGDNQLEGGPNSKKSCRMNRAETMSPPVNCLIRDSAHRRPSSVSVAVTRRAPRRPARSVG